MECFVFYNTTKEHTNYWISAHVMRYNGYTVVAEQKMWINSKREKRIKEKWKSGQRHSAAY